MVGTKYDAIVIGGGTSGVSASLEGASLGGRVLLVNSDPLPEAGEAVRGMITTGLLRNGAHKASETSGLRALKVAEEHGRGVLKTLLRRGVTYIHGRASIRRPIQVVVPGHGSFEAPFIFLATGSRPRRPRRFLFDDRLVVDSQSALLAHVLRPRRLVIVGAEIEGCEFACLFQQLGVPVTLIERRRKLLRVADREILEVLHERMQAEGIEIAIEEEIAELSVHGSVPDPQVRLRLSSGRVETCDRLLVLAGREGNVKNLGLSALGIGTDSRGFIPVDEFGRIFAAEGLYAIGDAVGYPWRASIGIRQGRAAMRHALGANTPPEFDALLAVSTLPELAVAGLTEQACRLLGEPYATGLANLNETLAGRMIGVSSGRIKLVFQRESRQLLGAQVVGHKAIELGELGASFLAQRATADAVAGLALNHPSLAEAFREAALAALEQLPLRCTDAGRLDRGGLERF